MTRPLAVLLSLLLAIPFATAAAKPNLVLIFIDDMGYGDIEPFGSTLNRTPNLTRMAAEGMKLTSFYAAPVCSASRAQLMTGCYAPRVGVPGVFFPKGPKGLNPDEHTVADYLQELGYATACVGKWHLGDQREFLPTRQGFDSYFGIPYSNDMQRVSSETGKRVHPLMRDEEPAELLEDECQRRITRLYTEEAVKFIGENKSKPFFLYMPHTAMHVPLFPHPDFAGKSNNGTYGDWVEEVDWSVGQVLTALKENGVDENTLVLFTSDNGPWASKGKAGGVSGPLRGSKGCTLEGGVREPTIARWPGKVKAGTVCDAIAGTTDVLPTFVKLAGGAPKADVKIDGEDIAPLLLGETEESPHEAWHYFQGTRLQAVRSGPWKLAISKQSIGMGMKEKPADLQKDGVRLYNLGEEIGELTDLADQHPDIVARLQKFADAMVADIAANTRPPGRVENPVTLYPTEERKQRKQKKTPVVKAPTKPIDWKTVEPGDQFPAAAAPNLSDKAFTIKATFTGDRASGVLLSHGGSAVGYSLYLNDGKAVFAVRHSSDKIVRITANCPQAATSTITATLDKEGGLFLLTEPGTEATGDFPGYLQRHPSESLCIGHDAQNPLDALAPAGSFTGKIEAISITAHP
jgi:arylsulfatase A-like enzyme